MRVRDCPSGRAPCMSTTMSFSVVSFYRFVALADLAALSVTLRSICASAGVRGTILIAPEGLNGTIAGPGAGIASVIDRLDRLCGIRQGEVKISSAQAPPFRRLKVRIRPEIITFRSEAADPDLQVGTYVEPADWNATIADPDTLVLDTRNRYETRLGSFEGAVDPRLSTFTDFKAYVDTLDPARHRRIAMFCTGGIRCEKASSYMLSRGFETVFHLKGGILRYLEEVPTQASRWRGDCYVFDGRIAVGHGLAPTDWTACHGCGQPLTPDETRSQAFEAGVSCPYCADALTDEKAARLRERQRQMTGG